MSVPSLRPTLELSARAKAGEVLHYVVVLSNPTDEEIALDPCPGYLQIFGPLTEGHSLNCDEAPTVPAHGRVRFAMQLRLPSGIAGRFTLHWDFNVEGDANASGSVTVS